MDLYYQENLQPDLITLDADESRHAVKVLRKKPGDTIYITDGKGTLCTAQITAADPRACQATISTREVQPQPLPLALAIAPTKNLDRIEWLTEKGTEIGLTSLLFFKSRHSERKVLKTERLQKKALSAMKQSQSMHMPHISELLRFEDILADATANYDCKFIAWIDEGVSTHLYDRCEKGKSTIVLIGPEGDFSEEEVAAAKNAGFVPVSLGSKRLRTETAGLAAIHTLTLLNR